VSVMQAWVGIGVGAGVAMVGAGVEDAIIPAISFRMRRIGTARFGSAPVCVQALSPRQ